MIVQFRSHPQSPVLTSPAPGDGASWPVTTQQRWAITGWAIKALLIVSAAGCGSATLTRQREEPVCPQLWLRSLAQSRSSTNGVLNGCTSCLTDRWRVKFPRVNLIGHEALKMFLLFEWLAIRPMLIRPVIVS